MVSTKFVKAKSTPGLVSISNSKKIKIKPKYNFDPKNFIYKKDEIQ